MYALLKNELDWYDAKAACKRLDDNASLATPRNIVQNACVQTVGKSKTTWLGASSNYYDYGTRTMKYQYVDGSSVDEFSDWVAGEPVRSLPGLRRCAIMTYARWLIYPDLGWATDSCRFKLPAICQSKFFCCCFGNFQ